MRAAGRLIACSAALFAAAGAAHAGEEITGARYAEPTTRYDHGILGDAVEWGALEISARNSRGLRLQTVKRDTTYIVRLPKTRVFEDIAPRLADVDGDGFAEVIVVETDLAKGARLAIYYENGMRAATLFIGRTHRWLAPLGAADLDGDGRVEIAYVDRPHLAKVLRIWRYEGGGLRHLADVPGLTNHRIGWDRIPGGIRDCGRGPEMITADSAWRRVIATTWDGRRAAKRDLGAYAGEESLARAMACKE